MPTVRKSGLSSLGAAIILVISAAGDRTATAAIASGTSSSNWEIMMWTNPLTVSVDTASIESHAARVTARVLWDYAATQTTGGPAAAKYRSMVGMLVFDCATARFGAVGGTDYSDDGGAGVAVAQYAVNPDLATLSPTEPGTIGGDLVTYVCEHIPR